jgi:hypothetical protein
MRESIGVARLPSLDKEGWPRHQKNDPVPLKGADGVVRSSNRLIRKLNEPPRLRALTRLRGILLMGAATPPYPRRGVSPEQIWISLHRTS